MSLRHVGYRAYQCVFGLGARLLPWRQPETITGPGSLADRANAFIDAIFAMNARLGIPAGFTCIREADLPQMAAWAAKEANPTYPVPVIYDRARFIRVIQQVMQ